MIAHGSNQCARCVGRRRGRDEGNLLGDGRLWIGGLGVERANERRGNDVVFELTKIAEFVQLRGTLTRRIENTREGILVDNTLAPHTALACEIYEGSDLFMADTAGSSNIDIPI